MELNDIYYEEELKILNLEADFKTEEEIGVGILASATNKGKLECKLVEYVYDGKKIPLLLLGEYVFFEDVKRINNGEIIDKLERQKFNAQKFIKKGSARRSGAKSLYHLKELKDTKYLMEEKSAFLTSFNRGEILIICPNPYILPVKEEEVNKGEYFHRLKESIDQDSMTDELNKRRKKIYNENKKKLLTIKESFDQNGAFIGNASGPFHTGINMYFSSKEDIELLKEYQILPFEEDKETGKLVRLEKEVLDNQIKERVQYKKKVEEFRKKLEKVKKKLKKSGKEWYSLDRINKMTIQVDDEATEEEFHVWLNPSNQMDHDCGWYSLEELKLWIKDKGPIMKTEEEKQ